MFNSTNSTLFPEWSILVARRVRLKCLGYLRRPREGLIEVEKNRELSLVRSGKKTVGTLVVEECCLPELTIKILFFPASYKGIKIQ